jgi:hypothetical protein
VCRAPRGTDEAGELVGVRCREKEPLGGTYGADALEWEPLGGGSLPKNGFVIDTERLSLRLRTKADAVCNLELLREHEGGTTMSIDEVEQRLVEQNERAQWEGFGLLSIRPRDEMRPIGYCGLNVRRCSFE